MTGEDATRVLVVDDEELVRSSLARILKKAGYLVEEAENGHVALDVFRRWSPHVVVTDIIMPEKEGIETIIELRKLAPDLGILAISGGGRVGNTDFLKYARELGADEVLTKPFTTQKLIDTITNLTKKEF